MRYAREDGAIRRFDAVALGHDDRCLARDAGRSPSRGPVSRLRPRERRAAAPPRMGDLGPRRAALRHDRRRDDGARRRHLAPARLARESGSARTAALADGRGLHLDRGAALRDHDRRRLGRRPPARSCHDEPRAGHAARRARTPLPRAHGDRLGRDRDLRHGRPRDVCEPIAPAHARPRTADAPRAAGEFRLRLG